MFDAIFKNPKLLEGMIGSAIRLIPPAQYQLIHGELVKIANIAAEYKAQLDRIEAAQRELMAASEFHETVLRNMEGNGPAFAERDMYTQRKTVTIGGIPIELIRPGIMESDAAAMTTAAMGEKINGNRSNSGDHGGN